MIIRYESPGVKRCGPRPVAQKPPSPPAPPPRISLVVPFRPGCPVRERAWQYIRARYAQIFPSWEIVTAPGPDGEFSRAGAIVAAASKASGDVFVVADADVWCDGIADAVSRISPSVAWSDPAGKRATVRMTKEATDAVLAGGAFRAEGAPPPVSRVPCGGIFAISRAAFFRCPPDPRFVGWGAEDHAWAADLTRMFGPASTGTPSTLWHLWHPTGERTVSGENMRLLAEHLDKDAAERKPAPRRRILVLADVPTWAWARKANALKEHLSDRFDIQIAFSTSPGTGALIAARKYDVLHTFEVNQASGLPTGVPFVTGITAHVWPTWEARHGTGTVKKWASRAVGVHANSILLQQEMASLTGRDVWYVPNGVDETFFRRTQPRSSSRLVVGFVGKDNPRKGHHFVAEACKRAGVELRDVRRNSKTAISAEGMREFYQGIHVLAVASDMDGTPNPALEAAACECAVVSNRIGNMPEFINHGVNGLLVERSVDGLTAALRDLASRPLDEVEAMGQAARRTVEAEWTWKAMAENYAEMWAECVGGRGRP